MTQFVNPPKAVVVGCQGTVLTKEEKQLFAKHNPLGFILFARNIESKEQVQSLCYDLRQSVSRDDAPILIDQEGGRVARLRDVVEWPESPPFRVFGDLYKRSPEKAKEALALNIRLQACYLREIGITVNCSPVLDLFYEGAHDIIGDRSFSSDKDIVSVLGALVCRTFLDCGITPVIKHVPGHGRALADSHLELPHVDIDTNILRDTDFYPFMQIYKDKILQKGTWSMVAHILYPQIDLKQPATTSSLIVSNILRDLMKNEGFLIADDIGMKALKGTPAQNAVDTLQSGLDCTLSCNHTTQETADILEKVDSLSERAWNRFCEAESLRKEAQVLKADKEMLKAQLYQLLEEENIWHLAVKELKLT